LQTAKEIMTTDVITVSPETTVESVATILAVKKISGVPVIDEDNNLLGIVTENDLIDQVKKVHIPTAITLLDSVIFLESEKKMETEIRKMTGATAIDICTKSIETVSPETPIDELATIMAEKKVHTLPVIDNGELVGIIGKTDIIRTLVK